MDIKTDLLVRVALKHGLVSEETIAEVMREQAENKAKGLPSLKLGDALLAKGLIDLEKAKKFLREKSDTSTQVQFEELDASLQAGEKDCLADFESFDDLGSEEFSHELPAAQAPVAPAVGGAAKAGFEPEAETELEEEEELLVEDDEPPAPAPQPPQPGPQPEKTLLMPRSPKPEAGKPAAGEPEKTLIMPRSPKPAASQPVAGQPEKTLVMPRPAKPQPTTERPVALPTVTAPVPPAAPAKAAPAPNAGSQYDSSQTIAVPSSELKPGALDYQSTVNSDPMVGKMFGEYRIIQRLGADVAGVTYRAVFLRECRVVTLRILKMTSMANNPAAVEKFIATVRRAYKLEHPKIQRILTAGQNGKQLYYAAEYFTGNSLRRELMQKHTLSAQETINVALSVADALAYAHSAGMYHTQIDPSKIIIGTDGNVKLLGFGLGIEAADNLDWLAESLGDMPYYVAPEMATSGEARKFIGAVTDLYSLGAVMFHCLTGTPPFHGETLDEILLDMYQEENLHERLYASDTVPPELAELVLQLLNPEPQKRIGSAQDLIKLLRKVSNELMAQQTLGANGASAFGVDLGPAGAFAGGATGAFPGVGATGRQPAVAATLRNPPVSARGFVPGGGMGPGAPARAASPSSASARSGSSRRGGGENRHANKKAAEAAMNTKIMIFGGIGIVLLIVIIAMVSSHQAQERERVAREQAKQAQAEKEAEERRAKEEEEKAAADKLEKEKAAEEKKKKAKEEKAAKKTAARKKTADTADVAARATAAPAAKDGADAKEEEVVVEDAPKPAKADEEEESDSARQKRMPKRGLLGSLEREDD